MRCGQVWYGMEKQGKIMNNVMHIADRELHMQEMKKERYGKLELLLTDALRETTGQPVKVSLSVQGDFLKIQTSIEPGVCMP